MEQSKKGFYFKKNEIASLPLRELPENTAPVARQEEKSASVKKEKPIRKPFFLKTKYDGRGMIRLSSLLLFVLAGYELNIRLDDLRRITDGIRYACEKMGVPYGEFLSLVFEAPAMQEYKGILLFLLMCCVLSVIGFVLANRPLAAVVLVPLCAATFAVGISQAGLLKFEFTSVVHWIKLVPFFLIFGGCVVNLLEKSVEKRYRAALQRTQAGKAV